MMTRFSKAILIFLAAILIIGNFSCKPSHGNEFCENGMVVTAHYLASEVGLEILKSGGNAFDAAVAVQFALAVVYPRAGNIGGGGFAVIRTANGEYNSLDFREKAPQAAFEDMYLDAEGNVISELSQKGHLAVGVPGSVDGMVQLHQKYGKLSWNILLEPAIRLAGEGVVLSELEAKKLNDYRDQIARQNLNKHRNPYIREAIFCKGDTLKNPDLHDVLIRIQNLGRRGFYEGPTANLIVDEMEKQGGLISHLDLQNYHSVWRKPLIGEYRQHKIICMPPPSSGGIALLQLLKGAENFPLRKYGFGSFEHLHLMIELERRVYADRATWLGDPDFYSVPTNRLISNEYLDHRFSDIEMNRKTDSQMIKAGNVELIESFETTHFSIVDQEGNVAAVTTTLNGNYGSKVVVEGGGFFLNNEMDDFSCKPGSPNQFGLVGGKANSIQPNKRMLSSMTPTIIEKDGALRMVLGSPGGSTIITSVFQNIINFIDFDMAPQDVVNAPRIHSQWLPDEVYAEPGAISDEVKKELKNLGHHIEQQNVIGMMANIFVDKSGRFIGVADRLRHDDCRAIGY